MARSFSMAILIMKNQTTSQDMWECMHNVEKCFLEILSKTTQSHHPTSWALLWLKLMKYKIHGRMNEGWTTKVRQIYWLLTSKTLYNDVWPSWGDDNDNMALQH
jgi:hypothetical protein